MKIKVLFVCLGNICRSPLAEGLFCKKIANKGLDDKFEVDSCGTGNYHIGELPDKRTRENAAKNGLKLTSRARQFNVEDFSHYNYIVAMDSTNQKNVVRLAPNSSKAVIVKMRDFDHHASGLDVPDPYFGGEEGFQEVYEILSDSVGNFIDYLVNKHQIDAK